MVLVIHNADRGKTKHSIEQSWVVFHMDYSTIRSVGTAIWRTCITEFSNDDG